MPFIPEKPQYILDAALTVVARYGFRKTSMLDIAVEAGISRAALYLHFRNKEDVFRNVSAALHAHALQQAKAALMAETPVMERLTQALTRFKQALMDPITASPHGKELLDANLALAADISNETLAELGNLIERALKEAERKGEINLSKAQCNATDLAKLILAAVEGFKHSSTSSTDLGAQIALFMQLLGRAL